jgi:hypothetical protein
MTIDIAKLRAWIADVNDDADNVYAAAEALALLIPVYEAALAWFTCDEDSPEHDRIETLLMIAIDRARKGGEP